MALGFGFFGNYGKRPYRYLNGRVRQSLLNKERGWSARFHFAFISKSRYFLL
jgi:hypothetical protein